GRGALRRARRESVVRRWRLRLLALLVVAAACSKEPPLVSRPGNAPAGLVLRNVRIFDAPHAQVQSGQWGGVVRDGRIATIARAGVAAAGLVEIDGAGGTLLPGLVDVHAHVGTSSGPPSEATKLPDLDGNLAAFLYAGVTTTLDLGALTPAIFGTRDA